jgi:hypothetical protein
MWHGVYGLYGGLHVAKSGNPAKAAKQHTLDEAKAAVRAGKAFLIKVFPNTEVVVRSTDEDEAIDVIKALQPMPDKFDAEQLMQSFHEFDTFLTFVCANPEYNSLLGEWLNRLNEIHQFNKEYPA